MFDIISKYNEYNESKRDLLKVEAELQKIWI